MNLKNYIEEAISSGRSGFHDMQITENSSIDDIVECLEYRDYKETRNFTVDELSLRKGSIL